MTQPDDQRSQSQQPHSDLPSELRELGQQHEQTVRTRRIGAMSFCEPRS